MNRPAEVPAWAIASLLATVRSELITAGLPHDDHAVAVYLASHTLAEDYRRRGQVIPFKPRVVVDNGGNAA